MRIAAENPAACGGDESRPARGGRAAAAMPGAPLQAGC